MLRSSRVTASLIRSLMLGTAMTVATAAVSTTLVGCKDESQPEYWAEKLEDAQWRPRAVKRLEQFFEDAVTRANKDVKDKDVQALLDKIAEPLTKTYVDGYDQMDTKTRVSLIKLLASMRDKRTEPALKKAFDEFAKRPKSTKDEQDIKWAAIAAADLKSPALAQPMLDAFQKMKASTMLGGIAYRDVNEAMVAVADKSWMGPMKSMLDAEMVPPRDPAKDKDKIDPYRDQSFWQVTAAEVLGKIGDASAVEPLLKVMLDPSKADVQTTALLALVKIGKPAVDETVKLLRGQNDNLATFAARRMTEATGAKDAAKDKPHVRTAALILGTIGRPEAVPPMVEVLKATQEDLNKAVIARELTKLPPSPESKQAFKDAFATISVETVIPPGANALQMLAEAAGQFYDPEMIDWLLERAENTKGGGEDLKSLQGVITVTALKLAKPDQLARVKGAVDKYGTQIEKDLYAQTEAMTKACGDRVSCYLAAIEKSENQEQKTQFAGIKAGYMIGILGNEQTLPELIERLGSIDNASVRFVAAQTIDQLSPKGSKDSADKLRRIIEKNAKSPDRDKAMADAPLKQVMYRLEARAG
jgi:HEAT repeat protein